jgi:hypothetical protein
LIERHVWGHELDLSGVEQNHIVGELTERVLLAGLGIQFFLLDQMLRHGDDHQPGLLQLAHEVRRDGVLVQFAGAAHRANRPVGLLALLLRDPG